MGANDTVKKTFFVATLLCVVCSVLVSGAAVLLGPRQEYNRTLDIRRKLLLTAGLLDNPRADADSIEKLFGSVTAKVIDLETGKEAIDIVPENFVQQKAAKDPLLSKSIDPKKDLAKIKRRSRFAKVYLIKKDGRLDQIVLPIKGKGLWSTLYGFLSLEADTKTVRGFGYYEHGETPGLGGEVDNPRWKAGWKGKILYDESFNPIIDVVKGRVIPGHPKESSQVDGLSGATITANGVEAMLKYWLGEDGFGSYLSRVRSARP